MPVRKLRPRGDEATAVYWDTTVFLDVLDPRKDERRLIAKALWSNALQNKVPFYTSTLTIAEVAFLTNELRDVLELDDAKLANINAFWMPPSPVALIDVTGVVAKRARDILRQCRAHAPRHIPMSPADALHIGSALTMGIKTFYTHDEFKKIVPLTDTNYLKSTDREKLKETELDDQRGNLSTLLDLKICAPSKQGLILFAEDPHHATS